MRKNIAKVMLGAICMSVMLSGAACQNEDKKETSKTQTETTAEPETETERETETEIKTEAEAMEEGWHTDEKGRYFIMDGERLKNTVVDLTAYEPEDENGLTYASNFYYAFDEDGYVCPKGWLDLGEDRYYVTADGWVYLSVATIDDEMYAFTKEGKLTSGIRVLMLQGEYSVSYFNENGRLKNDWVTMGSETTKTFYFGEDCNAVTGWQEIDGKTYYFGVENDDALADYIMATGKVTIDGKEYEFGDDGVLKD